MDYVPDEFSKSFGGMGTHVEKFRDGYRCLVYDLGPNVVACGEGKTSEEAVANTKKVRWGYALRLDFMCGIPEEHRKKIGEWVSTLTSENRELICDMLEETQRQTRKYQ